jgi:hypothetical protein
VLFFTQEEGMICGKFIEQVDNFRAGSVGENHINEAGKTLESPLLDCIGEPALYENFFLRKVYAVFIDYESSQPFKIGIG